VSDGVVYTSTCTSYCGKGATVSCPYYYSRVQQFTEEQHSPLRDGRGADGISIKGPTLIM